MTRDYLIQTLFEKHQIIIRENEIIRGVGKKIKENQYLIYEIATNRFYILSQNGNCGKEYFIDELMEAILNK